MHVYSSVHTPFILSVPTILTFNVRLVSSIFLMNYVLFSSRLGSGWCLVRRIRKVLKMRYSLKKLISPFKWTLFLLVRCSSTLFPKHASPKGGLPVAPKFKFVTSETSKKRSEREDKDERPACPSGKDMRLQRIKKMPEAFSKSRCKE